MLPILHRVYGEFIEWTGCNVIKIYVDDFDNDLDKECNAIHGSFMFSERGEKMVLCCTQGDHEGGHDQVQQLWL